MATRVFLLSGDEKAVHAITQILDELEVSFEHSSDPTFTLKRLGGQRFEVLVVDCDNVQTATQVFNSARSSAQNKGAIAIAIVEGKAGVPNAFRLGASLVLTKPVSLEQARNTLRTGVGMARKDGPESKLSSVTAHPAPAPSFPVSSSLASHAPTPAASAPTPISSPAPVVASAPPIPTIPLTTSKPAAPVSATHPAPAVSAPPASPVSRAPEPAPAAVSVPSPAPPIVIRSEVAAPPAKPPIIIGEKPAPAATSPVLTPVLGETKAPVAKAFSTPAESGLAPSLTRASSTGAAAAPAISKVETSSSIITKEPEKSPLKLDSQKLFPASEPAPLDSLHDTDSDHAEDSAASLRAQAVPAFGGLNKQPFAGLQPTHRGHAGLIVGLLLVAAVGGMTAAWYLKPEFRKAVEWKYGQVQQRVAGWRGHSTPAPAPLTTAVTPLTPAATPQPPATTASPLPTTVDGQASSAATASNVPSNSAAVSGSQGASSAPAASASAASTPSTPPLEKPAKPATPDAKQDVANHSASSAAATAMTAAAAAPAKLPASTAKHPAPSDILEVPEDFADDQVIHRVHPVYPKQARGKKLQGSVVLQAIVDKQGKINSLQLVSGDPILAQAAADAVKQWRYKPYSHNGEPSFFQTRVTVDFHLP